MRMVYYKLATLMYISKFDVKKLCVATRGKMNVLQIHSPTNLNTNKKYIFNII